MKAYENEKFNYSFLFVSDELHQNLISNSLYLNRYTPSFAILVWDDALDYEKTLILMLKNR